MMKYRYLLLIGVVSVSLFFSCGQNASTKVECETVLDSVSYAIGVLQGESLKTTMKRTSVGLDEDLLLKGLRDGLNKDNGTNTLMTREEANAIIQSYFEQKESQRKLENLENGRKFLQENSKKPGILQTPSGLQYRIDREGTGLQPRAYDTVEVNYRGLLIDGKEFESSYKRGVPVKFYLSGVIKGWTEGIQLMRQGGKYTFYIPTELAYGEYVYNESPFEANVPLIFEVELLKVIPGRESQKN